MTFPKLEPRTEARERGLEERCGFLRCGARPPRQEIIACIDAFKERFGVEPICCPLPIAPSTYYAAKSRPPSAGEMRDETLKPEIRRVHRDNFGVYGVRKVWLQPIRDRRPEATMRFVFSRTTI